MGSTAYELLAAAMRYVFLALVLFLLVRIVIHSLREYKELSRVKKKTLPPVETGYLVICRPEDLEGEQIPLSRENLIGSGKRCDIIFEDCGLFETHAFIYEKKGNVYLEDLGSKGGTFLNGEKIRKNRHERLFDGDLVEMGELALALNLPKEEEHEAV